MLRVTFGVARFLLLGAFGVARCLLLGAFGVARFLLLGALGVARFLLLGAFGVARFLLLGALGVALRFELSPATRGSNVVLVHDVHTLGLNTLAHERLGCVDGPAVARSVAQRRGVAHRLEVECNHLDLATEGLRERVEIRQHSYLLVCCVQLQHLEQFSAENQTMSTTFFVLQLVGYRAQLKKTSLYPTSIVP